ncbi:membrane dipeptidase [Cryptococcus neoformans var. grubii H99]|uniref:Dipeptidase n=1 Tax=Cryptococcus neoformans (strain H99 / ATCC 208821 / CBS 10515 / FGSC 9487) TaxID=235443 RepID=J9VH24_CRYN9|nr:membrane dipeptidase [Cryptococcus neoformans var. grubii H99]AFR93712.1 membrane dipeptidase [Cryptococcus neoformans var. grubii H99]AUB23283.1 membrane dipeptidase [Cryptococcus neoformans var. grubii]|eukprot:XP_012048257.1 membrane dipeptidase [Cryptococcus neoformans var. grubii H99]
MAEQTPLLSPSPSPSRRPEHLPSNRRRTSILLSLLALLLLLAAGLSLALVVKHRHNEPTDFLERAHFYLARSPVIDGHIDLPEFARAVYGNNIEKFDLRRTLPGHFDIPRAKEGHLGAFFWSIFTECRDTNGDDFLNPTFEVRDALEQLDVSNNLISKYSDTFALARTADQVEWAIKHGKIASLFGLEGAHMLGNSLGVLRMYHQLGVRYMTLTHSCNNAFADSAGIFGDVKERWGGLSPLGRELIPEMNRLGIFIDLSHVSDQTALQALNLTEAPVILSHSCARHFNKMNRNVPDNVLDRLGREKGKVDGVVMVNFFPVFASPNPDLVDVAYIADEIEYIANKTSKNHVGIGSDYDGIESVPKGLEDVSKYPYLFAELIKRGWSKDDLSNLAGGNLLRAMRGMEDVSRRLRDEQGKQPSMAKYDKRRDLDGGHWDF